MDEENHINQEVNPRKIANIFSIITFFYNFKILIKGKEKDIEEKDLYKVLPQFEAKKLGDKLESQWQKDIKQNKDASILISLIKCFGWIYLLYGLLQLAFGTGMLLLQPMVFSKFVAYFEKGQTRLSKNDALLYASAIVGLDFLNKVYNQNFSQLVAEYSMKVRTAVCSVIFRKSMRISPVAFSEITIGKVVTFLSKDVYSIDGALMFFKDMIIGYLQLVVVTYLLYSKVVFSAFSAIGVIVIIVFIQILGGIWVKENRLKNVQISDKRYKILQETLSAIKIVKMYVWQNYFEDVLQTVKIKEIEKLKMVYYLKAFIIAFGGSAITLAFYTLLMSYIAEGYEIDAETVYFVQQCLSALSSAISVSIPFGITQTADTIASMNRIQAFLVTEELKEKNIENMESKNPKVYLNKVSVEIEGQEIIKLVSINLKQGLFLITGSIGSGKSILLKTILREYPISDGEIEVTGNISYVPEEPWLFPSTIKQNIIFGQPYDEARYQEVLKLCALIYDIQKFKNLDQTKVGDKGMNLSKGQQARISLARAIYKESDIYLLDGCLNSLDNHVSSQILNNCIKRFLKEKICILVTNNISHIKSVNRKNILFLDNSVTLSTEQESDKIIQHTMNEEPESDNKHLIEDLQTPFQEQQKLDYLADTKTDYRREANIYHEQNKGGKVLWSTYLRYFKFLGGVFVCFYLLLLFGASQFCMSYAAKLVSMWVNLEPNITKMINKNETNTTEYRSAIRRRNEYLSVYTSLITVGLLLFILKGCSSFCFCLKAALKLHEVLIKSVLNCYVYFFDYHLIGNIINRLSKDSYTIDEYMPFLVFDCSRSFFSSVGVIVLLSAANWGFVLLIVLLFIALFLLFRFYLPTGRSLRRLEAATRSPIIGYLNSTLEGLPIVRATQQQDLFKFEFDRHQDLNTSAYYMNQSTTRLFAFLVDILGTLFILGITFKFILFPGDTQAGDVALAISQAMSLSQVLQWVFKQTAEVETVMTSVERILEYADAPVENKNGSELKNWPLSGILQFSNVSLKYKSESNVVLKNISCNIEDKSKIGIVGRTGAGKSSIISILFRLYDFEGVIRIDNEDICTIPLDYLRSSISIIPQDPILFSGTFRANLDPLQNYSDDDIWNALETVHLKTLIDDLNRPINDSSTSFSSGQKQLICLAKAILQNNKIIVLDEATANLDPETDQLLHKTVQCCFNNCTVLMITHRLDSVLSCEKVIVIDAGKIVEFGEPKVLLTNKAGFLYKLLKEE